ncbi:MAG: hypothetical protein K2X27_20960 [Candidatus Obscuribacterales bacterium]|nr:hypothetical protein [Candidatus Obscuribacterales bacterium]
MADFISTFQSVEETLRSAAGSIMSKFDQMTFRMLVSNLKSTDRQTVLDTLKQLEEEKRSISIPPIFCLSVAHPDKVIRLAAKNALSKLDTDGEVEKLTSGKEPEAAVKLLIEKFGNFKQ